MFKNFRNQFKTNNATINIICIIYLYSEKDKMYVMITIVVQTIVLGLSILGTSLVFFNSPFVQSETYLYCKSEVDFYRKRALRKRKLAKIGFAIILISYIIQTTIVFIGF